MGRQDYEGAPIDDVGGQVAGSSDSDAGSGFSSGFGASGQTFSGGDLYGEDQAQQESGAAIRNQLRAQAAGVPVQDLGFVQSRTPQGLPEVIMGQRPQRQPMSPFAFSHLFQKGMPSQVTRGFAAGTSPLAQIMARQNYSALPSVGMMSLLPNAAESTVNVLQEGGIPVYDGTNQIVGAMGDGLFGGRAYTGRPGFDPNQVSMETIKDAAGNIIGYKTSSLTGTFGDDDGGEDRLPGVPVAAVTEAAPEAPRAAPEYIYPEGGVFHDRGLYYRRGLLDEPVPGLLDYTARNEAFRRGMATDASLYGMPYDLSGYTLLNE